MTRRKLAKRDWTDWEVLIKTSIHNAIGTNHWGCLNKQGKLFRISTLSSIQIPKKIVNGMESNGTIILQDDDYYSYIPTKKIKKRARRSLST